MEMGFMGRVENPLFLENGNKQKLADWVFYTVIRFKFTTSIGKYFKLKNTESEHYFYI